MLPLRRVMIVGFAITISCWSSACITRTRQYGFDVTRGATIEDRIANARAVVTEERITRLRNEIKSKYPTLTPLHLEHIGVRWDEHWAVGRNGEKEARSVTITVMMEDRGDVDTAAVVETAARILDAEVNGPEYSFFSKRPS